MFERSFLSEKAKADFHGRLRDRLRAIAGYWLVGLLFVCAVRS